MYKTIIKNQIKYMEGWGRKIVKNFRQAGLEWDPVSTNKQDLKIHNNEEFLKPKDRMIALENKKATLNV